MSALLAAMQWGTAFRTVPAEVHPGRQRRGAIPAAGSRHGLHQSRKPRTGDIKGGLGSLGTRTLAAVTIVSVRGAVALLVASLFVLAIAFHWQILYSSTCILCGGTGASLPACNTSAIQSPAQGRGGTSGRFWESADKPKLSALHHAGPLAFTSYLTWNHSGIQ